MPPRPGRTPARRTPSPSDPARDAATRRLAEQAARFPNLDITPRDDRSLNERDAAFAHAIYDAALRRWLTLEAAIGPFLRMPWDRMDPRLRACLLAGAAQLLLLDKVPTHAALNESVEWAKRTVGQGAAAAANAILRRVAELRCAPEESACTLPRSDGGVVHLRTNILPDDPASSIAAATSHPVHLIRRWADAFGLDEARRLALHNLADPPTTLNTSYAATPPAHPGLEFRPHEAKGHHVARGPRALLASFLASRTDLWVQDASSSLAVASIADLRPGLVIDLCAGQGTKTRQLAAALPDARVLATDVDEPRLRTLRAVAKASPRVQVMEIAALKRATAGSADLVLLDVPCSNTGVLARRVEARYRADADQLARLTRLQREIIADAARLLSPRGVILYSTCSLEREENEDQVAAARAAGFRAERVTRTAPAGLPGEGPERYRDGAFSALLIPQRAAPA